MQRSDEVRQAVLRFYDGFSAPDAERAAVFEEVVSREHDGLVIGTAPEEWVEGRDAMKARYGMEGVRLEAGHDLVGYEQGSVGWVADRPRFVLPDGSTIDTRMTAVLLKEDGQWRLVQGHFSVAVPDEEAAG